MLHQKDSEALRDDVGVGRRHGDALRVDVLQAVDQAVALRRGRQACQLRDVVRELLVERCTFIEGDRRAEHRDQIGALSRELLRARHRTGNRFVVALDRHAVEAQTVADELHAARVEAAGIGRNRVVRRRENQTDGRRVGRQRGPTQCRQEGSGRAALKELATIQRHWRIPRATSRCFDATQTLPDRQ